MSYTTNAYGLGGGTINYTASNGIQSDTGTLNITVTPVNYVFASDLDVDTQPQGTAAIAKSLSVGNAGSATFPNLCTVSSVSDDVNNASCACDGSSACTMTYDTMSFRTGSGIISYSVSNGVQSDTGTVSVTVTP